MIKLLDCTNDTDGASPREQLSPFREDFNLQRAKALQVNQALHKLDDGQWIYFLDFGHLFIQPDGKISKDIMRDFLHPSPAGYRIWAQAMEPKLAELIGDRPVSP